MVLLSVTTGLLPPPPRTLLPPPRRRQAAAKIVLLRFCHRHSLHTAATVLPPLRCALPPRFALPVPPLTLPPPSCCQAAANVALLRCQQIGKYTGEKLNWFLIHFPSLSLS